MIPLTDLWLPIAVSTVGCFVASSILWMCSPLHKGDYKKIDGEDELIGVVKKLNLRGGLFMFPYCTHGKPDPAAIEKFKAGPCGTLLIRHGGYSMGKPLAIWFIHLLIVCVLLAYIASLALQPGADFMSVAQVVGTAGLLAFAGACLPEFAWKGVPGRNTLASLVDALLYTIIVCVAFGLLWPKA
ncbi:MAG: hypothetical protein H7210_12945 [Pyrinomonadaceae bacterium]|nr:hypothetical protein [Phycisphaerales bacterium]